MNLPAADDYFRDAELVDFAREAIAPLLAHLDAAVEILAAGRRPRGRRGTLLTGALHHALAFSTWRSLSANGVGRTDAVTIVTALVDAAQGDR